MLRKDFFQHIDELVDKKVHDGDIAEVPGIELTLLFVHEQGRSYFLKDIIHFL